MSQYLIQQVVNCNTLREAQTVAAERFNYNENYGFWYQFGAQTVVPAGPILTSSVVDRIIKKAIAGAALYYVSRSLKEWAKE